MSCLEQLTAPEPMKFLGLRQAALAVGFVSSGPLILLAAVPWFGIFSAVLGWAFLFVWLSRVRYGRMGDRGWTLPLILSTACIVLTWYVLLPLVRSAWS